jgi:hypothetical protein
MPGLKNAGYADVLTVDKRIEDLLKKAFQKLRKTDPAPGRAARVLLNIEEQNGPRMNTDKNG